MTVYDAINKRADEIKARKQSEYQALLSRTYREEDSAISKIAVKEHHQRVDAESLGILNVEDSLLTLTTEQDALLSAGEVQAIQPNAPLLDVPDKYKDKRPCSCPDHEGTRWTLLSEFSERKAKNGKKYPSSWCKICVARYVREVYRGSLSRFP